MRHGKRKLATMLLCCYRRTFTLGYEGQRDHFLEEGAHTKEKKCVIDFDYEASKLLLIMMLVMIVIFRKMITLKKVIIKSEV